ncbi:DUF6365 family protein [[Clostridium] polysaccharolyticum]|uniref:Uncharacterized protein n=1 Tax=[Clostridium] polysaccharolyticum TaxID=29364 RepID=A0A1H9ZTE7_9FIRM|nr:DUF6365 family protein [[Clostridium] polysaccharolyticum]SES84984.1 hypothetical protein SAMN04487772_104114 [[Clostridium] polysaccharolyticum]
MRVAFIVTSYWAFGELLIAIQFAEELKNLQNRVLFIIPPTHKKNVEAKGFKYVTWIPKSRKFNQIILAEVEHSFCPEVVILSDFLNYSFADKHYGILREDLDIFGGKLATFDIYNWSLERKCMDTYGFVSPIPNKVDIKDYGAKILPCPLINPENKENELGYRYSVVHKLLDTSQKNKEELRKKYGFHVNEKIILVSYAKWQESHIQNEKVGHFIDFSGRLFDELIIQLSFYYTIICIGKETEGFRDYSNIHCYDSMPAKQFDEYAMTADLYIGKNMTSTSMIRLALSEIMCVNIINSIVFPHKIEEKSFGNFNYAAELEDIHMYKYMMLPVGWYEFLKPVFQNNPYADIVCMREQFKMNETMEVIHELLFNEQERARITERVAALKCSLEKLKSPIQIVNHIINE